MQFNKNIWLIYNVFLVMGLVYLVATAYSRWEEIRQSAVVELAYLNRIFASSITLNFDQQEIMLDLLGRQIMADKSTQSKTRTRRLLDKILQQNNSLLAFGLADMDGDIVVGSSNLDLDRMPNLKELENSGKSFVKAMHIERMVLGRTYFLAALDDLVIPIRKGIRGDDNQVIGVMTAGIKPRELLPRLGSINQESDSGAPYQLQVFHDYEFYYAYASGIADKSVLREFIDEPMSMRYIEMLEKSLEDQLGLSLETLREDTRPVVFSAEGSDGRINLHSIVYLPKYQMWSSTLLPRDFLLQQLLESVVFYVITFFIIFGLAFLMFRRIATFEQKNHQQLVYQPQVADSKSPVGVEALIRWQHAEKGLIPPDRFIPVSEGNGMIIDIGHYVIDQALEDISRITDSQRCTSLLLSINVSIRQLQENGFVDRLAASLAGCNFPAQQLTLEITEGIFIDDLQYLIPVLNQIRDLGVKISLDDFGTGYSSLSLLKQLPIDELKIDKSFIDNITTSDDDRLMVLNIIDIAQNLGIQVVAEGIEGRDQSRMLIELGCNLQQGYYFCQPVKLEQLMEYCDQTNWTFDQDGEDE